MSQPTATNLSHVTHVVVPRAEWERLIERVEELHALFTQINEQLTPVIESVRKGGIMSLLRGF